jgi:glycosyltransferase involved in cell wall biosynthesis
VSVTISVLTICRNDLEGLRRTVDSVTSQTRKPDEFVVLDGASTDGTVDFLRSTGVLTTWKSEPDAGIADAFNKVVRMASGDWVLYLNAGDEFADNQVLESVASFLADCPSEIGVVYGDAIVRDPTGLQPDWKSVGRPIAARGSSTICHQSTFIRTNLQLENPFDSRLRIGMDYDLLQRLSRICRFRRIDRTICFYRLGGISSSRNWGVHSIIAHHLVDWLNADRRLGFADVARLMTSITAFRCKKLFETVLGRRLYSSVKWLGRTGHR